MGIRINLKDGKFGFVEVVSGISSSNPFIKITDANGNYVASLNSDAMEQILRDWSDIKGLSPSNS